MRRRQVFGFRRFLFNFILVVMSGALWIIWQFIRTIRKNLH